MIILGIHNNSLYQGIVASNLTTDEEEKWEIETSRYTSLFLNPSKEARCVSQIMLYVAATTVVFKRKI
jgi:hypothetical protein